jgi:phage tail-like protein
MATNSGATQGRAYGGNNFSIEIDGSNGGVVQSATGGLASATVISENMGVTSYVPKHLGNVTYSDISFKCGTAMSKGFYDWMKASFDANFGRKNGAIVTADYNYAEVSRLTFFNALIKSIGFPKLSASSNDPAQLAISLGIEKSKFQTAGGAKINSTPTFNTQSKRWTCANFRLKIDGLDAVCAAVTDIDGITLSQNTATNATGELRDIQIEPTSLTMPDLVCTFNESASDAAWAWYQSFVIDGKCDDSQEKSGTLEFLTTDLQTTMFTLNFQHLGVYKMEPTGGDVGTDDLRKVKMTMYCEHIDFNYNTQFIGC